MNYTAFLVFQAMAAWVPPLADDTPRYAEIAQDIADVAEESPVFPGDDGALKTAIYMAAVGSLESFYRADIDAFTTRGDHGRAWGLLQVHLLPGEKCDSRIACLRIGRERVRDSLHVCRALPEHERLSRFMTGKCMTNRQGRFRMFRAMAWWKLLGTTTP